MFILDTNVISELRESRSKKAAPSVLKWARSIDAGRLYLSAITLMEIELGVLQKERRDARQGAVLRAWLEERVLPEFISRILIVDTIVARRCAHLHVPASRAERDALIAATALVHGMTVVTRNTADFQSTGVVLFNPWEH